MDHDDENRLLGQTIYGDATGDLFGYRVDVSSDGYLLAIASPGDLACPGYVRLFSLCSSDDLATNSWNQIGIDITGKVVSYCYGWYVFLSGDGKTVAIGADGKMGMESFLVT